MRWLILIMLSVWHSVSADESTIRRAILGINPAIEITAIRAIESSGFFEVALSSGERIYTNASGTHFVAGDLYRVEAGGVNNVTDVGRRADRLELIDTLRDEDMVVFSPAGEVKHRLVVFTDIDCGYCRKLHEEIDQLLAGGVEVRYAAFPRAGAESESFAKYVSVFCAEDQQTAMTLAKRGVNPETATCANPVQAQMDLGRQLGISGTPTLVFENGEIQPGYTPAAELLKRINQLGS